MKTSSTTPHMRYYCREKATVYRVEVNHDVCIKIWESRDEQRNEWYMHGVVNGARILPKPAPAFTCQVARSVYLWVRALSGRDGCSKQGIISKVG